MSSLIEEQLSNQVDEYAKQGSMISWNLVSSLRQFQLHSERMTFLHQIEY